LPPEAMAVLASSELVLVTKAMTRSTVHRPAWLDYVAVKRFDESGQVVGEARFLGLYTATAYTAAVAEIPQVRQPRAAGAGRAGVVPDSHAAKSLQSILDVYPRDELFQIDTATLTDTPSASCACRSASAPGCSCAATRLAASRRRRCLCHATATTPSCASKSAMN
jgi:glutamate dehydrogenase